MFNVTYLITVSEVWFIPEHEQPHTAREVRARRQSYYSAPSGNEVKPGVQEHNDIKTIEVGSRTVCKSGQ